MASEASPASPQDISKLTRNNELLERTQNLDPLESSEVPPGPGHKVDPKAVLKRPIIRKQPSLQHLKARKRMIFPGWYTQSPSTQEKREPQRQHRVPEHCTTIPPSSPVNQSKTVVDRCKKSSSPQHKRNLKQMIFSAMHGQLTSPLKKNDLDNFQALSLFDDQPSTTSEHLTEDDNYKLEPVFHIFRKVYNKKLHSTKTTLLNNLLIFEPRLRVALMEIRKMSCQIIETGVYQVMTDHTYTLKEFHDAQLKQHNEILSNLEPFRTTVKDVAVCAGREYLLEQLPPDEDIFDIELNARVFNRNASFIYWVDFEMFNTVHYLVLNALEVLLTVFQNQVGQMPCQITPQTQSDQSEAVSEEHIENKVLPQIPLFMCELMLESNVLMYKPSEENFQETIRELIRQFKKTGMSLKSLTEEPEIDSLMQSKKVKCCPSLNTILEKDSHLQLINKKIEDSLHLAFDSAKVYSDTFNHFLAFSSNIENLDFDALGQEEPDLTLFAKTLELYHSKHKEALAIQEKRHFGLLLVDQTKFKQKLVSSTLCSLEASHGMLIQQARKKIDALLAKVGEAKFKLEYCPCITEEIAEQLIFLDEMEDGILDLQDQHNTISKVYNMFKAYCVTVPPEDLVHFATLQPAICFVYALIDDMMAERDARMERFISSLATDQSKIKEEVTKLACVLENPDFLEINANSSELHVLIEKIQITVNELEALVLSCNLYERKLKLEITRFDLLEETTAKFRLILLLWNSVEEWDCLENKWQQTPMKQLDVKQLSFQINNYNQHVEQLESGLPPNRSVVVLKDKAERMKEKLPVISNLCDLCMKPRLWMSLEILVGAPLNVEEVTLATLEEHDVFSYGMEILELLS